MNPSPPKYRAFTQKYPGVTNRIIRPVHVFEAFDPANPPPNPKFITTNALWDTGATQSVITETTARTLGLAATGKKLVHHAGGKGDYNTYVVNFLLPN